MGIPFHNENFASHNLDLNELLIKRKSSTFIMKVEGDSMNDANIYSGDILIIDRSKDPINGSLIVAEFNSQLTVKEYFKKGNKIFLTSGRNKKLSIEISPNDEFSVWGVITFIIHHAEKNNSAC